MLARRDYFRAELERRFRRDETVDAHTLGALLDEFEQRGWLCDARAAQGLVDSRQRRFGAERIARELEHRGAGEADLARLRPQLQDGEVERARTVWRKRFGTRAATPEARAKQLRFLRGRGFGLDVIERVLDNEY